MLECRVVQIFWFFEYFGLVGCELAMLRMSSWRCSMGGMLVWLIRVTATVYCFFKGFSCCPSTQVICGIDGLLQGATQLSCCSPCMQKLLLFHLHVFAVYHEHSISIVSSLILGMDIVMLIR